MNLGTNDKSISMICSNLKATVHEVHEEYSRLNTQVGEDNSFHKHLLNRLLVSTDYASGCAILASAGLGVPMVPLCRSLFEGFVGMYWATQSNENSNRAVNAANLETLRIMRLNLKKCHAKVMQIDTGADRTTELLQDPRMNEAQRLPRFDHMADGAGIRKIYDQLYGLLSLLSHGSGADILANRNQTDMILSVLHAADALLRCIHLIVTRRIE